MERLGLSAATEPDDNVWLEEEGGKLRNFAVHIALVCLINSGYALLYRAFYLISNNYHVHFFLFC